MPVFSTSTGDIDIPVNRLIVAGWTARDRAGLDHHIKELEALGVAPPTKVPLYYQVSASLITQAGKIEVLGDQTSGEVEPLLVGWNGEVWLGLGSDHTDRKLETYSVAHSKQICAKPVANELWHLDEVIGHIDQLELSSQIAEDGDWVPYQNGTVGLITALETLMKDSGFGDGAAMFCGTFGAIGGVRPASKFRMSMYDAVLKRSISAEYEVQTRDIIA